MKIWLFKKISFFSFFFEKKKQETNYQINNALINLIGFFV